MKLKQVTTLLTHVKNRFTPTQNLEMKQSAGLTVQSGLKAGEGIDLKYHDAGGCWGSGTEPCTWKIGTPMH